MVRLFSNESKPDTEVVCTKGMRRIPFLNQFARRLENQRDQNQPEKNAVYLVWGLKPSSLNFRKLAAEKGTYVCTLEDGFLRSFLPGGDNPPLSLVADDVGIYYDGLRPSALEQWFNSDKSAFQLTGYTDSEILEFRRKIVSFGLSKYNHAPDFSSKIFEKYDWEARQKVLVIDQTFGDLSLVYGGADETSFTRMLASARSDFPEAVIVVKTHPEVTNGVKKGYLSDIQEDENTCVLRSSVNPVDLIKSVDVVYVVTSTMGFEALLVGKPVVTFGVPWYAGWGVTDDRLTFQQAQSIWAKVEPSLHKKQRETNTLLSVPSDWTVRRTHKRSVDELFAIAYCKYARYLNPMTKQLGSIADVMDWLLLQKNMARRFPGRMVGIGFRRWKAVNIRPMLSLFSDKVFFIRNVQQAEPLNLNQFDCLIHWGKKIPEGLCDLAKDTGARVLCMEDGFVRSVGLGSDLIRPHSLVLDDMGIYFDPLVSSNLEILLNQQEFDRQDIERAQVVRQMIVDHHITKYNVDEVKVPEWLDKSNGKQVILVPGQVEDDASILFGCTDVRTNIDLLRAARQAHPDGFIVYKVHPDVLAKNRKGKVDWSDVYLYADVIETEVSVVSCIEACDVVHTMTSLTGFDALLRGKKVVVYGRPFYAGWGLTEDRGASFEANRRQRLLSLDELVAGALLYYPIYYDWELKGYTTCEATLHTLIEKRDKLSSSGGLSKLKVGFIRRQIRKLNILAKSWLRYN